MDKAVRLSTLFHSADAERASRVKKKAILSFRFPTVVTKPFSAATTTTATNEEDGGRERVSGGRWSGAAESEFDA